MKLPWKLLTAKFISRPNRFLTEIEINGTKHLSHLPDPGRLKELLFPGVKLLVKKENGPHRKTGYSTQAVYSGKTLISINSWLPNTFVEYLIQNKSIPFLKNWQVEKREHTVGKSRFDFLLRNDEKLLYLEVKSVTYVENGVAKFPDAVTERGRKHLMHLSEMKEAGKNCMVLFVVQRHDVDLFTPQWERDPKLGKALVHAKKTGVVIHVIKSRMQVDQINYIGEIPFDLSIPDYV